MTRMAWELGVLGALAMQVPGIAGCAAFQRLDLDGVPTLSLEELRTDPDAFANVIEAGHSGAVVTIAAGERLPVRMALRSAAVDLEAGDSSLRFDRDAYLYVSRTAILVSPDRERWTRIGDVRHLRQLFGVDRGDLEIAFGVHRTKGPLVTFGLR